MIIKYYLVITCFLAIFCNSTQAQSPEKMSYQAIIRDASNNLINNSLVGMRINILQGTTSGASVYAETHSRTTNANGLLTIEIGSGTVLSGSFDTIDWSNGPYFMKTETDPSGGTNYSITSTSQLMSVPYALYAKNSGAWKTIQDTVFTLKKVGIGTSSPLGMLDVSGGARVLRLFNQINTNNFGVSLNFDLKNSLGERFLYANIGGSIQDNTAGAERGFLSFKVADGSGIWSDAYAQEKMRITSEGYVGINTTLPRRALHVNDILRLEPRNTAPTSPAKGDMYFDNTINKLRVFDGTVWQNCW